MMNAREEKPLAPAGSGGRRSVLAWATLGLAAAALAEILWIVVSFVRPRRDRSAGSQGALVVAGSVDDFAAGSVTAVPAGRFYLVRLEDGGFLALHRRCPHLGCTVPWEQKTKRFVCPCHGSSFDVRGDLQSPPAPRALDLFPVRIENGLVKVDVSRPIERSRFEADQVARS
jgi:cytochrome b6-f complex iron-sulfur subunit